MGQMMYSKKQRRKASDSLADRIRGGGRGYRGRSDGKIDIGGDKDVKGDGSILLSRGCRRHFSFGFLTCRDDGTEIKTEAVYTTN